MKGWVMVLLIISLLAVVSAELEKDYMCNTIYKKITENLTMYETANLILSEKNFGVNKVIITYYEDNWEEVCSGITRRTLKPKELCDKVYFLVLNTDYNYTSEDIRNTNFSDVLIEEYITNNRLLCSNYTAKLPDRKFPTIKLRDKIGCEKDLNFFFDFSVPFFEISFGDINCSTYDKLSYVFDLEFGSEGYSSNEIRMWFILAFPLFIVILIVVYSIISSKKEIERIK